MIGRSRREPDPRRAMAARRLPGVLGVTLVLADGVVAHAGGKVVKNVAGYDLAKLVTGAYGTLGLITEAVFRLHPLPPKACWLRVSCADSADVVRRALAKLVTAGWVTRFPFDPPTYALSGLGMTHLG